MRLTDIGWSIVQFGAALVVLGASIEYVRAIAREESRETMRQEATEAVRRHELVKHRGTDEPNA